MSQTEQAPEPLLAASLPDSCTLILYCTNIACMRGREFTRDEAQRAFGGMLADDLRRRAVCRHCGHRGCVTIVQYRGYTGHIAEVLGAAAFDKNTSKT
ncbi:hypothetical protein FGG78_20970 [Thioclava sp. BHET1]|nr:hypothetical protein FGG78_20970 [Thioclava sp. BHET1]